ncbi:MAG TPA: hypothetical protein VGN72_03170 [Tepidisphaeraceae bacterium]|jgi:hypothetical protein|nr:hypothetical protein [Tepidisphaeraceae bacterium]
MVEATSPTRRLTLAHLAGVLAGRRGSVEAAARDPSTFWVGMVFVGVAALAREYDQEDLRRQPWHLLIPFAASVALSAALFVLVRSGNREGQFWNGYRQFLGLFWLTAPMALFYAIPYERFLEPAQSVRANLWTLAVVSAWRGFVTARLVQVVTGRGFGASFFLAAFVADVFAVIALIAAPIPTLQVMGGVRLTEVDQLLQSTGLIARLVTIASLPILAIIASVIWLRERPPGTGTRGDPLAMAAAALPGIARGPLALGAVALIAFGMLLPVTQPPQQRRSEAERLLRANDLEAAIATMSRHAQSDYPPLWDPPPRIGWPEAEVPDVIAVLDVIDAHGAAGWVRAQYLDKFERRFLSRGAIYQEAARWTDVQRVLDQLPEGAALRVRHNEVIRALAFRHDNRDVPTTRPATRAVVGGGK